METVARPDPPKGDSNHYYVPICIALSVVLTVAGAKIPDVAWLLWAALIPAAIGAWVLARRTKEPRLVGCLLIALLTGFAWWGWDEWRIVPSAASPTGTIASTPSQPQLGGQSSGPKGVDFVHPIPRPTSLIHDRYPELGKAVTDAVSATDYPDFNVYYSTFEGGAIIWSFNLSRDFALDYQKGTFQEFIDPGAPAKWQEAPYIRQKLHINYPTKFPYAGAAKLLYEHPDMQSRFGEMGWDCLFRADFIYSQVFENGVIIGPFRRMSPDNPNNAGSFLVLIYDDKAHRSGRFDLPYIDGVRSPVCMDVKPELNVPDKPPK